MKIGNLKTNHIVNPLGYQMEYLHFSWQVTESEGKTDAWTRVCIAKDEAFQELVYDSGKIERYGVPYYEPELIPEAETRYYWYVEIESDANEQVRSEIAWFETALEKGSWKAEWISAGREEEAMPCLYKKFSVNKPVKTARLYCCGLGLYEAYLGQDKIGKEYLLPGYHSYDLLNQYQTFDVTKKLEEGEHTLSFILGEGWYKGRFAFEGGYENLYGDRKMLTAMLNITYVDGSTEQIHTDKTWKAVQTEILSNNIYDGEVIDRNRKTETLSVEVVNGPTNRLMPRLNVPIKKVEEFKVKEIIQTPTGDMVLDFGETITGWVEVFGNGKLDFALQYAEHMQGGELYRENLRTAKSEFKFKGNAEKEWLRPHFTYYGFRYVKVCGLAEIKENDFKAFRLMSDMDITGSIETSNEKVNKLIENTLRSQKCNFLDIPMDCPQRDERMGWTGDIAVFARTASFHMYTPAFLHHYMMNLKEEQKLWKGAVPFFIPKPKPIPHEGINPFFVTAGACAWGDAATIIPWELYLHYQDKNMLTQHYPMMCAWVEYITSRTLENEKKYLWQNDRHLGDWLALDNGNIHNPIGKTDMGMIASAYYYYSTILCSKAAEVLGKTEDSVKWRKQAANIKEAFIQEYLDKEGNLRTEKTQTAYAILLYMGLYREEQEKALAEGLKSALQEYDNHISTGFVGTGMLMQALSKCGLLEEAYGLLLQEDYPSWLREVNLGATTMWERWNSMDDDGTIDGHDMNSLNHYAYGCVAGWLYEVMCGFSWNEKGEFYISPMPDSRFSKVTGKYRMVYGECVVSWNYQETGEFKMMVQIPFQAKLKVILPGGEERLLEAGIYFF
ncbi:MAG: family 78 glycoside hydrolase catalytic domain [Lachnospiraceae bacterium]|nr:family 78 glycoside hydrolase catalytic domain [Lachnospiraceae bacterium]